MYLIYDDDLYDDDFNETPVPLKKKQTDTHMQF